MKQSRLRKIAIGAGAGAVATVTALAMNPFAAGAADSTTPTTTTVSAPASVTTGHAVTFTAAITPPKTGSGPVVKATGTMTFTITGKDSSNVDCTGGDAPTLSGKGKAVCKVAGGSLLATASPYTVAAAYSGDSAFAASSTSISQDVAAATAHVKLTYDVKPASATQTTFTATVTGGGGALPTGNVEFLVAADGPAGKLVCNPGGKLQALSANASTPPQAVATCTLAAGWLKVNITKKNPHATATWAVTANYEGDGNFASSATTMHGVAKS